MRPPIRILHIDDSPLDRELVRDMLEKEHGGFVVTEVESREALERCLKEARYDLLLTDFNILGFDGLEVFEFIQERMPHLPVIVITGTGCEEVAVEAMRRGLSDYVVKTPAHIRRLPQTIANVLERQRLKEERKKAQQELQDSEKRLKLAVEGANFGLWDWNIQTGEATWSERATEMFSLEEGQSPPALPACRHLVHPNDWPAVSESLDQHLQGVTESFEAEFRLEGRSGQWHWVLVRGKSVESDRDGNPLRMAGTILDITVRKTAQTELAQTLDDLKRAKTETEALLEASKVLLESESFRSAASGIFRCCKRVIGGDAGYIATISEDGSENEILHLDPGSSRCTVEAGLHMPIKGLRGMVIHGNEPVLENAFSETQWNSRLPDGHIGLENVLLAPLTIEGEVVGLFGIANKPGGFEDHDADLARAFAEFSAVGLLRARSEQALEESEIKYRTLIDALPISVAISQEGRIAFVNRAGARMLDYDDPEQLVGLDVRTFVPDHEKYRLGRPPNGVQGSDTRIPTHYTTELKTSNGKTFPAEVFIESITYQGRRADQIIAIDISVRRRLEEQVRQAQKIEAVGTLAGGIAHDFNNLLQIISGHAELLAMELREKNLGHDELRAILYSAERGAELVANLLTFSRKVEPHFELLDLNQEVRLAERILYRTIPKMIELELDLETSLREIQADRSQIEQVLLNLALNAKDAMPDGGKLIFRTRNIDLDEDYCSSHLDFTKGDYVVLQVTDTGNGMDKDTTSHIFEPFFTTKKLGEGTGLGLSTVFGIVKMHGGHISCDSEPGKGASFKIFFPAAESVHGRTEPMQTTMPAGGSETILVVDDEDLIAALAKRLLEKSGYTVLTAGSGTEALEIYRKQGEEIDLVILDLIMPEMSGKQCLQQLLKINPRVKALMASGFAINGQTKEFLNGASKATISKPFKVNEMLGIIRRVLDMEPS